MDCFPQISVASRRARSHLHKTAHRLHSRQGLVEIALLLGPKNTKMILLIFAVEFLEIPNAYQIVRMKKRFGMIMVLTCFECLPNCMSLGQWVCGLSISHTTRDVPSAWDSRWQMRHSWDIPKIPQWFLVGERKNESRPVNDTGP